MSQPITEVRNKHNTSTELNTPKRYETKPEKIKSSAHL